MEPLRSSPRGWDAGIGNVNYAHLFAHDAPVATLDVAPRNTPLQQVANAIGNCQPVGSLSNRLHTIEHGPASVEALAKAFMRGDDVIKTVFKAPLVDDDLSSLHALLSHAEAESAAQVHEALHRVRETGVKYLGLAPHVIAPAKVIAGTPTLGAEESKPVPGHFVKATPPTSTDVQSHLPVLRDYIAHTPAFEPIYAGNDAALARTAAAIDLEAEAIRARARALHGLKGKIKPAADVSPTMPVANPPAGAPMPSRLHAAKTTPVQSVPSHLFRADNLLPPERKIVQDTTGRGSSGAPLAAVASVPGALTQKERELQAVLLAKYVDGAPTQAERTKANAGGTKIAAVVPAIARVANEAALSRRQSVLSTGGLSAWSTSTGGGTKAGKGKVPGTGNSFLQAPARLQRAVRIPAPPPVPVLPPASFFLQGVTVRAPPERVVQHNVLVVEKHVYEEGEREGVEEGRNSPVSVPAPTALRGASLERVQLSHALPPPCLSVSLPMPPTPTPQAHTRPGASGSISTGPEPRVFDLGDGDASFDDSRLSALLLAGDTTLVHPVGYVSPPPTHAQPTALASSREREPRLLPVPQRPGTAATNRQLVSGSANARPATACGPELRVGRMEASDGVGTSTIKKPRSPAMDIISGMKATTRPRSPTVMADILHCVHSPPATAEESGLLAATSTLVQVGEVGPGPWDAPPPRPAPSHAVTPLVRYPTPTLLSKDADRLRERERLRAAVEETRRAVALDRARSTAEGTRAAIQAEVERTNAEIRVLEAQLQARADEEENMATARAFAEVQCMCKRGWQPWIALMQLRRRRERKATSHRTFVLLRKALSAWTARARRVRVEEACVEAGYAEVVDGLKRMHAARRVFTGLRRLVADAQWSVSVASGALVRGRAVMLLGQWRGFTAAKRAWRERKEEDDTRRASGHYASSLSRRVLLSWRVQGVPAARDEREEEVVHSRLWAAAAEALTAAQDG